MVVCARWRGLRPIGATMVACYSPDTPTRERVGDAGAERGRLTEALAGGTDGYGWVRMGTEKYEKAWREPSEAISAEQSIFSLLT